MLKNLLKENAAETLLVTQNVARKVAQTKCCSNKELLIKLLTKLLKSHRVANKLPQTKCPTKSCLQYFTLWQFDSESLGRFRLFQHIKPWRLLRFFHIVRV